MEMIENKKIQALITAVFSLESRKGHLKWKVSELARTCRVSKSLVYYHLGKSKIEILHSCIDIVISEFYGLNSTREEMVQRGEIFDSIKYSRNMFIKSPAYTIFYLKWRSSNSEIGKKFVLAEQLYQKKLHRLFPKLSPLETEALYAFFHGLATNPKLSDEGLRVAIKWLNLQSSQV